MSYENFYRHREENGLEFHQEHLYGNNKGPVWYREIRNRGEIIYRGYFMTGTADEIDECAGRVHNALTELVRSASDPFAECWTTPSLRQWIRFITGYAWHDLVQIPRNGDNHTLNSTRVELRDIIDRFKKNHFTALHSNIASVVMDLRNVPENSERSFKLSFLKVSIEIVMDRRFEKEGVIRRLLGKRFV